MSTPLTEKEARERMYDRLRQGGATRENARELADKAAGNAYDNLSRPPREKRPKE